MGVEVQPRNVYDRSEHAMMVRTPYLKLIKVIPTMFGEQDSSSKLHKHMRSLAMEIIWNRLNMNATIQPSFLPKRVHTRVIATITYTM